MQYLGWVLFALVTLINFSIFIYKDITTHSHKNIRIHRGMKKENLLKKCNKFNLPERETEILIQFYCNKKQIQEIADDLHISIETVNKMKKNALDKFV